MSATFSPCQKYRYTLTRDWIADGGTLNLLMLNPSTADSVNNDPTVERMQRRALAMGFKRLIVTNIFAFRATDPEVMKRQADPVGPENDAAIEAAAYEADMVICAWGNHGGHLGRSAAVRKLLAGLDHVHCFKINKRGEPSHPLYLAYDVEPVPWTP